ncbi:MAG: serine hydrolase [Lachnospiraceae bacterium]|nr:serine hydrolase [Lachnospiraceae bacterium]
MSLEKNMQEFIKEVKENGLFIEGIAVADEKSVIFEHHFSPDLPRNIYSHTKSYTATAAGLAVSSGNMTLDDRLADYFPEAVPDDPDPRIGQITFRNLLTMSSGFHGAYLMNGDRRNGVGAPDYLKYMLSRPIQADPGSSFCYSSADSILAARMIEKATGKRLGEYLYENLFSRLGQGWPLWEHDPQGHPNGGGGIFMKLTEMMKLGQLYLAGGTWNGEVVLDRHWISEATAKQIETGTWDDVWNCGYGYQFWMSPYPGAYRADGAYGQVTTVLPEKGLVIAVQCPEWGDFGKVKQALHTLFVRI